MKKKNKGFTLIEVVMALATFMIVMLSITTILISVINYSAINKKTFNSNTISRVIFESIRETNVTLSSNPEELCGTFRTDGINSADDIRSFVSTRLFNKSNLPDRVSIPSKYEECKSINDVYSVGLEVNWVEVGTVGTSKKGYYEISTWCWDTQKGDVSEVNRKTYVTPR